MVAGEADIISDIPSTELNYRAISSPDKALMKFGTSTGRWPITDIATWSGVATRPARCSPR